MQCMKCNHVLPDDSEFCQYCGSRIEKIEVIPEVYAKTMVDEADTVSTAPVRAESEAPASVEMPKQTAEAVILPTPDFESVEPDDAGTKTLHVFVSNDVPETEKACKVKKVKQQKKKYCSRCGSLIDHQSKQCTGCGKKYFKGIKFNKISVAITVLSLAIAALIGLNVFQYLYNSWMTEELYKKHISIENFEVENENLGKENENLQQKNEDLKEEVSELKTKLQSQRVTLSNNDQAIERLQTEIKEYMPMVQFCKDYVRVIGNDGTDTYHKYGCQYFDTSRGFLVLNLEAAKIDGFVECPYCRYS